MSADQWMPRPPLGNQLMQRRTGKTMKTDCSHVLRPSGQCGTVDISVEIGPDQIVIFLSSISGLLVDSNQWGMDRLFLDILHCRIDAEGAIILLTLSSSQLLC